MFYFLEKFSKLKFSQYRCRCRCQVADAMISKWPLSSYQNTMNKKVIVIEYRNKNKQNVISYSQIRKIENISGEEISNNYILLISNITLNELVHTNRG